jgi:lipoprotein-releasing system permease protein
MSWSLIFKIAWTHLYSRKRQTLVAALGVTFGIAAYIIMMSFMTGLNGLLDGMILNRTPHVRLYNEIMPSPMQPIEMSTFHQEKMKVIHSVKPKRSQLRIANAQPVINFLKSQPEVLSAIPQVRSQGFYLGGSTELNGSLLGVDVLLESRYYQLGDYVVQGSPQDLSRNENGIILGAGVADKLSLSLGDNIQVSSSQGMILSLKIVGIYQSGLADIDNVQSYVNIKTAQRLMGESENYITDINVKLKQLADAPALAKKWSSLFKTSAIDLQTANAQFETGTSIRNMISYAVSITLLIVAGFGIYNTLNMLIYEKMNDIAILKATGFSGTDVKYIFITQAMLIGVLGGIFGLLVGFLGSVAIDNASFETEALPTLKTFPVNFEWSFYVIGVVFALTFTFLAGYLPAKRAERIDPVDIIRGQ